MSLSLWESVKSNAALYGALEIGLPLVGAGSLRLHNLALLSTAAAVTFRLNSTFTQRGCVKGVVRTLLHPVALSGAAGLRCGCLAMMSGADVTGGAGSCYTAGLSSALLWKINKWTGGLSAANTELGSSATNVPTVGQPPAGQTRALEFTWVYDSAQFGGGIALVLKVGTALDFSDLATVISVVDASSPLTTSVGEGVLLAHPDASATIADCLFDLTSVTKLT